MKKLALLICIGLLIMGCLRGGDTPKPRGYFRIALPEKGYQRLTTEMPYVFDYPVYAHFEPHSSLTDESYWGDLVFPGFNGRIHLSYKEVANQAQLGSYFEDARTFVYRHIPKATAINDEVIIHHENNVYGMIFLIKGKEAASPIQFYATDSTDHFLRGALYFNVTPNNDSLAPVIQFIEEDIRQLLSTIQWE